ncbi:hypothetical protein WN943_024637 [Citrus x changshan-huyou]
MLSLLSFQYDTVKESPFSLFHQVSALPPCEVCISGLATTSIYQCKFALASTLQFFFFLIFGMHCCSKVPWLLI